MRIWTLLFLLSTWMLPIRAQVFYRVTSDTLAKSPGDSRSVNIVDLNNDGNPDLFVSHEADEKNDLFLNQGGGNFLKMVNDPLVTALTSSISSSWGDVDNDGDQDIFITNGFATG
jgi:enediyne biosynthesis protein E4